jgi:hypothetical protein
VDLDLWNGDLVSLEALASGSSPGGGGDPGGGGANGLLQGVVFEDRGLGTGDMSVRLPAAQVSIQGASSLSAGAGDAYWGADVPAGSYTVTASAPGYQTGSRTCSVAAGGETWCSVGLFPVSGGDPGGGGDTGGGDEHGGFDPDAPRGLVRGYVVELNEEFDDLEACDGPRIGGAEVSAETGEKTTADASGYFEFEVLVGEHLLGAKAAGYADGAAECSVVEGGVVECCIHLVQGLGGE